MSDDVEKYLQTMSSIELVHKLRNDEIDMLESNKIIIILLERLVLRDAINHPDPYLSKPEIEN